MEKIYSQLNSEQKRAVDTIDGPLLVLAGPGTGKTQLLSARVANILQKTDTLPQNILCLTFTEAAALNMRERLRTMISDLAYDVHINTYHGFASDIITSYPEYFESVDLETGQDSRMERPIDEITQLEILTEIISKLPYGDALYSAKHYIKSVAGAISDLKQADLSPQSVLELAQSNLRAVEQVSPGINDVLGSMVQMPRKSAAAIELFTAVEEKLAGCDLELARLGLADLVGALASAAEDNSTKPITAWKNNWLHKDDSDQWTFTNPTQSQKLASLASIYSQYQAKLESAGQYDFNDMIIRTIQALREKPELKFNVQEKYQYVLLDEFQDTNKAQFNLVTELVDHPVHEGRPNIMAVGDDDQGIFAFQGADIGNMVSFLESFRDVTVINLTQNYRSHADILHVAHNVAEQIESRLHHNMEDITKTINAAGNNLPASATIARHEFDSQASEYGWIADQVKSLIDEGTSAHEIAVLAPKHAILEDLVPFLNSRDVPVVYEKRENIFETPLISGLVLFSEVILAGAHQNMTKLDELLPQLFSLEYWQIPTKDIWELNWQHYKQKFEAYTPWAQLAMQNTATSQQTQFVLHLASIVSTLPLEQALDFMTGAKPLAIDSETDFTSPLKHYYFNDAARLSRPLEFYEAISHLSVIRSHLRDQQAQTDSKLTIDSLVKLYKTYLEAEQPLLNTHPIAQSHSAVQLQTVYKAKGLEYEYVFLPSMHDDVWGSKATGSSSKISLPANLQHIKHDGSSEDTRRRILFVAITRAKHGLFTTSYANKENGKGTVAAKYFLESDQDGVVRSGILPINRNEVVAIERPPEQVRTDIDILWHSRYQVITPQLKSLLSTRLQRYVMSPTHLNTFTNLEYAGPQQFLLNTLLRFPEAQSADSLYGDALHNCLEWYQKQGIEGRWPTIEQILARLTARINHTFLSDTEKAQLILRGSKALRNYMQVNAERLKSNAKAEVDFRKEGVVLDGAILTGKIDRLEINEADKTVRIIDFKSGNPSVKWSSESKYLNYKQQLYFYMILIERSHTYKQYKVESAALEFIEPLDSDKLAPPLILKFDQKEYDEFKLLISAVWNKIQDLDLPDVSSYAANSVGTRNFIKILVSGDI